MMHKTISLSNRDQIKPLSDFWRHTLQQTQEWMVEILFFALIKRFVGNIILTDPDGFQGLIDKPVMYLGNHQVAIESLLFATAVGALGKRPILTIAKAEHRDTWLGQLITLANDYPGVSMPHNILFFDRHKPKAMHNLMTELNTVVQAESLSLLIHAEGARAHRCGQPVKLLNEAIVDLAMHADIPIVPVRFYGGLPVAKLKTRLNYPIEYARQDYYIGPAIYPDTLRQSPPIKRKQVVLAALNQLGPDLALEMPNMPCSEFAGSVVDIAAQHQLDSEKACVAATLQQDSQGEALFASLIQQQFGASATDAWLRRLAQWLVEQQVTE